MDTVPVHRLHQHRQESLAACRQNIARWQDVRNELMAVRGRLSTLPDRTRHQLMVPIGAKSGQTMPYAFMPGYMHHTNEILVLLGDNWFVERSAKQAAEIAQRRIDKCDEMLSKYRQEEGHYVKWLEYMQSFMSDPEEQEIVEEFDEERERQWREEHRAKVRAQRQREAHQRQQAKTKSASEMSHDELMAHLDSLAELELNEPGTGATDEEPLLRARTVRFSDDVAVLKPGASTRQTGDTGSAPTVAAVSSDEGGAVKHSSHASAASGTVASGDAFTGQIVERAVNSTTPAATGGSQRVSSFKKSRQQRS